jgi:capsular polysaccharide biosynthesis protein
MQETTKQLVMLIIGIMLGIEVGVGIIFLIVTLPDFIKDTKKTIKIIKDMLAKRHSLEH